MTHTTMWAFFVVKSSLLETILQPSCWIIHPHSPLLFPFLFAKKPLIIGVTRSWSPLLWGLRNMSAWLHTSECNHQHKRLSLSKLLHNFHTRDRTKVIGSNFEDPCPSNRRSYFYVLSKTPQEIWSVPNYFKYPWNFLTDHQVPKNVLVDFSCIPDYILIWWVNLVRCHDELNCLLLQNGFKTRQKGFLVFAFTLFHCME